VPAVLRRAHRAPPSPVTREEVQQLPEPPAEGGYAAGTAAFPARLLSREAIVTTAIRLLDGEALSALSMRRIADLLGTGAASLYWHVGSKDGVLDLVFDKIVGELTIPDPDPRR
jgi:AcrR family transcriptional regulator